MTGIASEGPSKQSVCIKIWIIISSSIIIIDRLCDLVVRVPGYRSRGPGSIPCATRFSEK
jgi:hypothetical protein